MYFCLLFTAHYKAFSVGIIMMYKSHIKSLFEYFCIMYLCVRTYVTVDKYGGTESDGTLTGYTTGVPIISHAIYFTCLLIINIVVYSVLFVKLLMIIRVGIRGFLKQCSQHYDCFNKMLHFDSFYKLGRNRKTGILCV